MARETLADDLSDLHVERGEQRQRAVPLVVMRAALRLAGSHGQERLGAVQRLDLALLVDAQHHGAIGRIEIESDDVAHLLHEQRVGRELEALDPVRLQPEGPPDAMDGRGRVADRRGHGAQAPVRGARGPRLKRPPDRVGDHVIADPARRARARLVVKAVQACAANRSRHLPTVPGKRQAVGDQPVVTTLRRRKHDAGALRQPLPGRPAPRKQLQLATLLLRKHDLGRFALRHSELLTEDFRMQRISRSGH